MKSATQQRRPPMQAGWLVPLLLAFSAEAMAQCALESPSRGVSSGAPAAGAAGDCGQDRRSNSFDRSQRSIPIAARFDIHWRNIPGPAWVEDVPEWLSSNAKNYRRRGLPLVQLWESSHYLVALGLSNHGVPGAYLAQKLPY
jgi:hypothetical protein